MTPFVLHCGGCGQPVRDCGGACDDERQAIMRAVCDSLALVNVPPPVVAPGVGGSLVLPGPTPMATPQPAVRYTRRYGVLICEVCGLAKEFCRGHAPQSVSAAQDGQAAESLAARIKDCQAR